MSDDTQSVDRPPRFYSPKNPYGRLRDPQGTVVNEIEREGKLPESAVVVEKDDPRNTMKNRVVFLRESDLQEIREFLESEGYELEVDEEAGPYD